MVSPYHYDCEVEPTPGVCEIFSESKGNPFDKHFKEKDDCKKLIHVTQVLHKSLVFLKVHVF